MHLFVYAQRDPLLCSEWFFLSKHLDLEIGFKSRLSLELSVNFFSSGR